MGSDLSQHAPQPWSNISWRSDSGWSESFSFAKAAFGRLSASRNVTNWMTSCESKCGR
jgi:hypothetical protein